MKVFFLAVIFGALTIVTALAATVGDIPTLERDLSKFELGLH